jgi:hypothetical protein
MKLTHLRNNPELQMAWSAYVTKYNLDDYGYNTRMKAYVDFLEAHDAL